MLNNVSMFRVGRFQFCFDQKDEKEMLKNGKNTA